MRFLNQFSGFDTLRFLQDKELAVMSCRDWVDYATKAHMGTRVTVAITADCTEYQRKDGDDTTNLFEQFTVKCAKDLKIPAGTKVELVNPVGTIFGDYRNQLSIRADDIRIVGNQGGNPKKEN